MINEDHGDATWAAGLLAMLGPALGGALVAEEVADSFVAAYAASAGEGAAMRIVPSSLTVEALNGAMDLAATLAIGTAVFTPGLLTSKAGLLVRRAERLDVACTSLMSDALDRGELLLLACVDSHDPDAMLAAKLEARLPFSVDTVAEQVWSANQIAQAKMLMSEIDVDMKWIQLLCQAALSIGISSPRTVLQAVAIARGVAALSELTAVDEGCVALSARLALAHRALHLPAQEQAQEPEDKEQSPDPLEGEKAENAAPPHPADAEVILEAITSAMPANLLQMTAARLGKRGAGRNVKISAPRKASGQRGRRIGNKWAASLARQRLDIIATLRAAAPWQGLRRKWGGPNRMVVTRDDFRVSRVKQRNEATAIFAVDASGSTAFQRLAEAKGAVETILAECYVRRDRVALVVFRGKTAETLLPPSRSLERAKRALAGLPGGGGTPLAAGLDEAFTLALQVRRGGGNPIVILLTDGRGNVTREGEGNKVKALEQSEAAAKLFAAAGFDAMVIDVSPEPQKTARALADAMHATYLPMPRANAIDIARPVSSALRKTST
jgi:magnesium chelatase subunit D